MNTNRQKLIWTVVGVVVLVVAVVVGYLVWTKVQQQLTPQKTLSTLEKADQAKKAGIKAEAAGKSEQALESYQAALDDYRKAGNEVAIEDMEYKVEFMQDAIARDKKATERAIKNGDLPSKE